MAKISAKEIIDSLKEMTLLEIKEVVDLMKEELGVDPSAVAVAAAPVAEAANEGPSTVDVVLASAGWMSCTSPLPSAVPRGRSTGSGFRHRSRSFHRRQREADRAAEV